MHKLDADRFLRACRRLAVDRPPVWILRQAGRYLPEYRELRGGLSFLDFCKDPERCSRATLLPVELLGVDAAIVFADILLPLEGMGAHLEYLEGEGPRIREPVRRRADVERLSVGDPWRDTGYVMEAIRRARAALDGRVPLIGFAGGPFTLACYLVEGGGAADPRVTRELLHSAPELFTDLLERLTRVTSLYLAAQVAAGAQALQLFDSWAGCLGPAEYARFAAPFARQALEPFLGQVPTILYVNGCGGILEEMAAVGTDVLSIDWRVDLGQARRRLGDRVALQGNLDPCALFASPEEVRRQTTRMVLANGDRPGYVANLGAGILPDTPVEGAQAMIAAVQETT